MNFSCDNNQIGARRSIKQSTNNHQNNNTMKLTRNLFYWVALPLMLMCAEVKAYMGGFESQDGYLPFYNNVNAYNAGQYGTNNGGPGGASAAIPLNTGLWSRIDPVTPGSSYVTGHFARDRVYTNSGGGSGAYADQGLVLTSNHQGWNAGPLHYRYNMDSRDYDGAPVASSANSVVNFSFWYCASLDQNVGNGYFGHEVLFLDPTNKPIFRLGITERAAGDKVTYWNGTTLYESPTLVAAAGRYDRWDISFNFITKKVTASYFEFATSTLHSLVTNVPIMDITANGLSTWEFKTSPGITNDKRMSIDDVDFVLEANPDDCLEITNGSIACQANPAGGYTYTYNFTLKNNSGHFVHHALIPTTATVPNNGSVTLSPAVIPVGLANGASGNYSITITGASPGQEVCFPISLFNVLIGECCVEQVCLKMPCVKLNQSELTCTQGAPGSVTWNFSLQNTSGGPIQWLQFLSTTPGVTFVPSQVNLGNLANNASMSINNIQILGAAPGSKICFVMVVMDQQLRQCCFQEHCLTVPDCGPVPPNNPGWPHWAGAEPCKEGTPGTFTSPDKCLTICSEKILCVPSVPAGGTPCASYTFTLTNTSTMPISHVAFPAANVSPTQVIFSPALNPGQATTITVQLCGVPPGPFAFPIVAFDTEKCRCCSFIRNITIPPCDCLQVVSSQLICTGIDANGTYCYQWTATIQNLETWIADHAFLLPDVPANVSFVNQYFNIPPIGQFGTATITSSIKAPGNPSSITFFITIHNADLSECCAIPFTLQLPPCCDCEKNFDFAANGGGAAGGSPTLPAGITLLNLEMDSTGKIGFPSTPKPFPYVYMACSGRGTIVRIDANTGVVLGEYKTVPNSRGAAHNPSRTTVDRFGECWVGNRNDNYTVNQVTTGSVLRIGLVIGGTRGNKIPAPGGGWTVSPSATGEYLAGPFAYMSPSVVDRDNDGLIRTSYGLGNILDWPDAGVNASGGVSMAEDECIVTFTRTRASQVRALAIDANNDLWVGGWSGQNVYGRISGATGIADMTTTGANPGIRNVTGGYGALIDGNNVLWSVDVYNGVYRHDIAANTTTFVPASGCYGIGVDMCNNTIWVSSVSQSSEGAPYNLSNQYILRRFTSAGALTGAFIQPHRAQGLSVDANGHPFVSRAFNSPGTGEVWHYNAAGTLLATITGTNAGSTGTAVDHNGKIWVSDYNGNQAIRLHPTSNTQELATNLNAVGTGATPYNYSDMTGYVSLNAAGQFGMLQYMHDSKCPNTDWGKVSWTSLGEVLNRCWIEVQVRASNNPITFPSTWTKVRSGKSFCGRGIKGRYIQVRVIFRRPAGCPPDCHPRLCTLRIECCDPTKPDFDGHGPDISVPDIVRVRTGNTFAVEVFASDPDNDPMVASVQGEGPGSVSAPVVNGRALLQGSIPSVLLNAGKGRLPMVVSVSDGTNDEQREITLLYGDQAPQISMLANVTAKAFSLPTPNFIEQAVVYDDYTAPSALILTQSPSAGTPLPQGVHAVVVSATDEAGNIGSTTVNVDVSAVVTVGAVVNYQVVPHGSSLSPVPVTTVPASEVALTELLVNGVVVRLSQGLMPAGPLQLPPGSHNIQFRIQNAAGQSSISRNFLVTQLGEGSPLPLIAADIVQTPTGSACRVKFTIPAGQTYRLMRSMDLQSWSLHQTVVGTGAEMSVQVPISSAEPICFFRLERIGG